MKKLIWLGLLLIICVVVFLIFRKDLNHSAEIGTYDFAIPTDQHIDQFFYASNDKNKGYLKFNLDENHVWWVDNGKNRYPADTASVYDLLNAIIPKLEVQSPVSDAALDNVNRKMALDATKAQFYHRGKLIKTFYAGDKTADDLGTYMYLPGSERPCVVVKPGHRGYLSPYFTTDINSWRTLTIISHPATEIASIEVKWGSEPEQNFKITHKGDEVELAGSRGETLRGNRNRMLAYLDMFGDITREAGELAGINRSASKDSILSKSPYFQMTITTPAGKKETLSLYQIPVSGETYSPEDRSGQLKMFETETYWGTLEGSGEIWVLQDVVMRNRMKRLTDFL